MSPRSKYAKYSVHSIEGVGREKKRRKNCDDRFYASNDANSMCGIAKENRPNQFDREYFSK